MIGQKVDSGLKEGRLYELEYIKERLCNESEEYTKVILISSEGEKELYGRLPTIHAQPPIKRSRLSRPTTPPVHDHLLKQQSLHQDRLRKLKMIQKHITKNVGLDELTERWKDVCGEVLGEIKGMVGGGLRSRDVLRQVGVIDFDEFQFLDLSSDDEEAKDEDESEEETD